MSRFSDLKRDENAKEVAERSILSRDERCPKHVSFSGVDASGSIQKCKLSATQSNLLIVHPSRLFRDSFGSALRSSSTYSIRDYDRFTAIPKELLTSPNTALIFIGLREQDAASNERFVQQVVTDVSGRFPVVFTGEQENAAFVADLLERGVQGYIPSSFGLDISIHAIEFVLAGGVFAPASCLLDMPAAPQASVEKTDEFDNLTKKQLAVIEAMRRGKANKTIAYELNMCESTVKVHVRNIMKKLGATNRTQVAYIANQVMGRAVSSSAGAN